MQLITVLTADKSIIAEHIMAFLYSYWYSSIWSSLRILFDGAQNLLHDKDLDRCLVSSKSIHSWITIWIKFLFCEHIS